MIPKKKAKDVTKDSPQRSILKAISWRVVATTTTMIIIYAVSGSLDWALVGGAFDIVLKLLLYYFHERLWTNIQWGKSWRRRAWKNLYNKMHAQEKLKNTRS